MKFKDLVLSTCLIFIQIAGVFSQSSWKLDPLVRQADQHYEHHLYNKALQYYSEAEKIHPEDYYSKYQIAECHRQMFNYNEARSYYKLVIDSAFNDYPIAHYHYGLMLKRKGNHELSNAELEEFVKLIDGVDSLQVMVRKAKKEIEGNSYVLDNFDEETTANRGSLINMGDKANSPYNDYATIPLGNDNSLLLTSGRLKGNHSIYSRYGESYSDFYQLGLVKGKWHTSKIDKELKSWNSKWSDGAGWLSHTKDVFYFTRCPEIEKRGHCKIYFSAKVDEVWQEPVALSEKINLEGSDTKHPSVTVNNDTLFFVSDRPDGFGKNDIYMSVTSENGDWTEAVNLGNGINTSENELSPFYDQLTNSFYFASAGHLSIGGIDLYRIRGNNFSANDIENLGLPINSSNDDYYLSIGNQTAFLSSNRDGGMGKFDVYYMDLSLLDQDGFIVKKNRLINSRRRASRRSYLYVSRNTDQLVYQKLTSNERSIVEKYIKEFLKREADQRNSYIQEQDSTYNKLSDDVKVLAERLALARQFIDQSKQEQLKDSIQYNQSGLYTYESIYFDFDQIELRPEAQNALRQLAELVRNEPDTKVLIKGFTDRRGDDNYNIHLSLQRSIQAKQFLVTNGIPAASIEIRGSGVYIPLSNGDSKLAMQLSRKVEIRTDASATMKNRYQTYITLKKLNIKELTNKLGMDVKEIQAINSTTRNIISANKPLRLIKSLEIKYTDLVILEKNFVK